MTRLPVAHGRSVKEWRGDTPDTPIPPRVRLRVFDRAHGLCHRCTRKIAAGERWQCDHVKALINGGQNRESNLAPLCAWCEPVKNGEDVAEKSDVYAVRAKHVGVKDKPSGRGLRKPPGTEYDWKRGRYVRPTTGEDKKAMEAIET